MSDLVDQWHGCNMCLPENGSRRCAILKKKVAMWICIVFVLALFCASVANADTVSNKAEYGFAKTKWNQTLNLKTFDGSLGSLTKVTLTLTAAVMGEAGCENLADIDSTVDLVMKAKVDLYRNGSIIAAVNPSKTITVDLTPYDGVMNWADDNPNDGPSYIVCPFQKSDESVASFDMTDMSGFIGTGAEDIPFVVNALGASVANEENGNVASYFNTNAWSEVKVTYEYDPIPEPGSVLALFTGIIGLAGFAHRQRR